jgi:hypothetical protein
MPKYVIERELPGAGKLSKEQLQAISQKSCGVLNNLGPQIQWIESFVTDDKIYCIYRAPTRQWSASTPLRAGSGKQGIRGQDDYRSDHRRVTQEQETQAPPTEV